MSRRGLAALLIWSGSSWAAASAGVGTEALSRPELLQGFVDGAMAREVVAGDMVGATVSIVHDGRRLVAKGYGSADLATARGVNAQRTLFRVGSIAKTFIWIAVAQQFQEGRLQLDDEINDRLGDLQIPDTYPVPITVEHLLNHSAGFEDRIVGFFAYGPRTIGSFQDRLRDDMPARVMLPGQFAVYSNYGAALAARIVETTSGQSWDDYVDQRILKPLRMARTTTRQPVPELLKDSVAVGYASNGPDRRPVPFEFVTMAPVGSASSTGVDMAQLMIELLRDDNTPVLTGFGRRMLFRPGHANDPRMNRMLQGFYERNSHGQRIVAQLGDLQGFHSLMLLYPELDLGLFLSFNSDRGKLALARFSESFNDYLFGRPVLRGEPSRASAAAYPGFYASMRAPRSGVGKLARFFGVMSVTLDDEGLLVVDRLPDGTGPVRLQAIDQGLFQTQRGSTRIAFREDRGVMRMFIDAVPYTPFERLPGWLSPVSQATMAGVSLLLFAGVLIWPLTSMLRRGRNARRGEAFASVLALVNVGLLSGLLVALGSALMNPVQFAYDVPEQVQTAMWFPVVAAPLLVVQLLVVMRAWIRGYWWASRRIHYTLLTFATLLLVFLSGYLNLLAVKPESLLSLA